MTVPKQALPGRPSLQALCGTKHRISPPCDRATGATSLRRSRRARISRDHVSRTSSWAVTMVSTRFSMRFRALEGETLEDHLEAGDALGGPPGSSGGAGGGSAMVGRSYVLSTGRSYQVLMTASKDPVRKILKPNPVTRSTE